MAINLQFFMAAVFGRFSIDPSAMAQGLQHPLLRPMEPAKE